MDNVTVCPCGKLIDSGPTCPTCAPAYQAGILRAAEIAAEQMRREEYGHAKHACGCILDAIRKEAENCHVTI